jgi:serine/threonine protein kinase
MSFYVLEKINFCHIFNIHEVLNYTIIEFENKDFYLKSYRIDLTPHLYHELYNNTRKMILSFKYECLEDVFIKSRSNYSEYILDVYTEFLNHPNMYFPNRKEITLFEYLKNLKDYLSDLEIINIIKQIIYGLQILHKNNM